MKIGIIGGGMTGLALALRLARQSHAITILEKENQLGGLATYHDFGPFIWDRFYHVILPSDAELIGFLEEIGLAAQLRWQKTRTGYFVNEQMYSVSNTLEFFRFPLINLLGKIRLSLTVLYCSRLKNWRQLEKISVEDWLVRTCGRKTYEKFWEPLLLAKLGESYRKVSAVFIWSYIKRSFSARQSSGQKEELGHIVGGYKTILTRLERLINAAGGRIYTDVAVDRITPQALAGIAVQYNGTKEHFDKVIFTGPVNVLQRVAAAELINITNGNGEVEYLGVICMVMLTKKPLVPYYVVNIADQRLPFTGVIGMSNVVDVRETAGLHLTYFPKYIISNDQLLHSAEEELLDLFLQGFRTLFPDFPAADIVSVHLNRAHKVQPLQVLHFSQIMPQIATRHPDFFVLNTSQFVNVTLNNNSVIGHVNKFLQQHGGSFEMEGSKIHAASFATV